MWLDMRRMAGIIPFWFFVVTTFAGCSDSAPVDEPRPNSAVTSAAAQSLSTASLRPSLSFSPEALNAIIGIAADKQLDWAEVVICLTERDQPDGVSGVKMTFESLADVATGPYHLSEFDSIPVAVHKDHIARFQNVRVILIESDGRRGFAFEKSEQ